MTVSDFEDVRHFWVIEIQSESVRHHTLQLTLATCTRLRVEYGYRPAG